MFKPEQYTISVRLENCDGENYYVGRVAELPDVMEFGETAQEAHQLVIDTIQTAMTMYQEQGREFPAPFIQTDDEFSGRIILRLPKSLHRYLAKQAVNDNVSLNTLLVSLLSQKPQSLY